MARAARDRPPRRCRVQIDRPAQKQLAKLPREVGGRIVREIDALADDPRPPSCEPVKGEADTYRIRVGDYRVVYQVRDDVLLVLVIRVGHRRDVYRNL